MKVGLAGRGFYGRADSSARETLRLAHAHGLDGVFFASPLHVSATLDAGELRDARALADDLGLYLEIGIGRVNPLTAAQEPGVLACGDGDFRCGMERIIRACHAIGCTDLWCVSGKAHAVIIEKQITIVPISMQDNQCPADRLRMDEELLSKLTQVTAWRWEGQLLVLVGPQLLRFRPTSN